jgi:SlyX protein
MTALDNRLVDIETQLAYQEDLIQSLNEVVISMQQQIDKLELKNQRLQDNVKQMETLLPNDQNQNEQPPHY